MYRAQLLGDKFFSWQSFMAEFWNGRQLQLKRQKIRPTGKEAKLWNKSRRLKVDRFLVQGQTKQIKYTRTSATEAVLFTSTQLFDLIEMSEIFLSGRSVMGTG